MISPPMLNFSELDIAAPTVRWIWDGYIAAGEITLFTALWKSGKTTLLAHLLKQRHGGGVLLGQAVAAGASVVVSEEASFFWQERHARLGLAKTDHVICRPFVSLLTREDWSALIAHLLLMKERDGVDLVILDPISRFLPAFCENDPHLLVESLEQLHRLTEAGLAVVLVHHPRKAASKAGATARGSGVLQSFVDIIIEMYLHGDNDWNSRRRRLLGFARHLATPRSILIELNAEMTGYALVDEVLDDEFLKTWEPIRFVLEDATGPLTRAEILEQWPDSFPCPKPLTAWRWLDEARDRGLVRRTGSGSRWEPFRYFLPQLSAPGAVDPVANHLP